MDREHIIAEILRTAEENGGVPLGAERFADVTGIGIGVWRGKFWGTWSEAIIAAGHVPNKPNEAHSRESMLEHLLVLTRRNGRFPTYTDLRMARQADDNFPAHHAFNRLGSREVRVALVRALATERTDCHDVLDLLPKEEDAAAAVASGHVVVDGAVYMLRLGQHFKIGKSYRVPQRHREISIELPEKPDVVHIITTDDPSGIEKYWHGRFAPKRTNGEWFALNREDVRAFKRRKFM